MCENGEMKTFQPFSVYSFRFFVGRTLKVLQSASHAPELPATTSAKGEDGASLTLRHSSATCRLRIQREPRRAHCAAVSALGWEGR
jgi:hypothetical protein